ncbi:ANTAR domain-containing protein [Streptomyces sp. YIM 130001]|uniref:ANTAR domain-containing protein n=1 Tax=Streptomyces sp. YIM 130001 TaxID=2259644 RepID=UPI0013C40DAC|nr:ANTAR domain-containing protein [Streptomyces sp. YIM 130001]
MKDDRRLRLWQQVVAHAADGPVTLAHVSAAMISSARVDSVGVTAVMKGTQRETVHASSQLAMDLEELTVTLGEGPGVDCYLDGPSLSSDLTAEACQVRWPVYAPAAVTAGVAALFALPLRVGGVSVGVVSLYRTEPGPLGRDQLADVLVLTDTALALLLDQGLSDPSQQHDGWRESSGLQHSEVHQATGMLTVQLGVSAAEALVRLRAYAFAHDRRLSDVGKDVVARRLRFNGSEA